MRSYSQIVGDGGSGVAEQIAEIEHNIARRMANIRHVVAIGSGKGGVGKSTLTRQLAAVLTQRGNRVGVLDADFNGPSQAVLGGVRDLPPMPGAEGLLVPRTREGIQVLSVGSVLAEGAALDLPSVSPGASAHLAGDTGVREISPSCWPRALGSVGLPVGGPATRAGRTANSRISRPGRQGGPDFHSLGAGARRGGTVARRAAPAAESSARLRREHERVRLCGCGTVRPLFPEEADAVGLDIPCLGRVPFDPELAQLSDRGLAVTALDANVDPRNEVVAALTRVAAEIEQQLEEPS